MVRVCVVLDLTFSLLVHLPDLRVLNGQDDEAARIGPKQRLKLKLLWGLVTHNTHLRALTALVRPGMWEGSAPASAVTCRAASFSAGSCVVVVAASMVDLF